VKDDGSALCRIDGADRTVTIEKWSSLFFISPEMLRSAKIVESGFDERREVSFAPRRSSRAHLTAEYRWLLAERTSFYHGALENKEHYTKAFLKQTRDTLSAGGYEVTKLCALLDAIVHECVVIATNIRSGRD
jgi:hypothetical protein